MPAAPSSPIRVVRLVPELHYGGVESRLLTWAQQLDRTQIAPRVCAFWRPGMAARALQAMGIPVDILGVRPPLQNLEATAVLTAYLRTHRPDILHCQITEANWHGAWAGRAAGVPIRILEETGIPQRKRAGRLAMRLAWRQATQIVAISQAVADGLIANEGVAARDVEVVPNPVGSRFLAVDPAAASRTSSENFRVLAVGRLVPIKNHDGLIRAFRRLVTQRPASHLTILGEGPMRGQLEALIASLQLNAHVSLPGFCDDPIPALRDADLYVQPSFAEGFGVALLEAMAQRVPVLATNVGGAVEILNDLPGMPGPMLLDPGDLDAWSAAMLRHAALSPETRSEIGVRMQQRTIERYAPRAYEARLRAMYQRLHHGAQP